MYCDQTVGWIKTKLGTEVGLDPGHIVLDGDPAPPKGGTAPPIFGSCLLWPNDFMDKDATWYQVGLGLAGIVTDGDPAPLPQKGGAQQPPIIGPCIVAKRLDG